MSSNDEMYSILTPCLSLSPTPTPFLGGSFFLSSLFVLLAYLKYSQLYLLYLFFLPTRF